MVNDMFEITNQTLLFLEFWEIQNPPPPRPIMYFVSRINITDSRSTFDLFYEQNRFCTF